MAGINPYELESMTDVSPSLDPGRRAILTAAARRILPSDDGPGAAETGVAAYVDRALGEAGLRHLLPLMEQGLDLLDELAREDDCKGFASLPEEQQDRILRRLEELEGPLPRTFLRRLVFLCLEGFLSDPGRGGNRDGLGWRLIEFPSGGPTGEPPKGSRLP